MGHRAPTWPQQVLFSGIATSTGVLVTNPLDVVKVRLQTHRSGTPRGFFSTTVGIVRSEGPSALWKGVVFAVARSSVYGAIRLGLYAPLRDVGHRWATTPVSDTRTPRDDPRSHAAALPVKIVAGMATGALAALLTNPLELLKVRQQGSADKRAMRVTLRQVLQDRGVRGLWDGTLVSMQRSAALTAAQAGSYDHLKQVLRHRGYTDSVALHVLCSFGAGLITTTAISPFDVLKTRLMQFRGTLYRGAVDCLLQLLRDEGPSALLKGWVPSFVRQGPMTVIVFVVLEQLHRLAGVAAF